jgi:hypothetical protein
MISADEQENLTGDSIMGATGHYYEGPPRAEQQATHKRKRSSSNGGPGKDKYEKVHMYLLPCNNPKFKKKTGKDNQGAKRANQKNAKAGALHLPPIPGSH